MTVFTSAATGNWTAAATWDVGVSYPQAGDTAIIANTHTVTIDTAAQACTTLTVNAGGTLTDATNNKGLTVSGLTSVSGTLTCGSAAMSFGSGQTGGNGATLKTISPGVFNGGSGNHTVGVYDANTGTITATSGTTTLDFANTNSVAFAVTSGTFNHNNGTIVFTKAGLQLMYLSAAVTFYNLTLTKGAGNVLQEYSSQSAAINVANNLTITSGTLNTRDNGGTVDANLTVTNNSVISGTLVCNSSVISLASGQSQLVTHGVRIASGGVLTGGSGNHTYGNLEVAGTWTATSGITNMNGCGADFAGSGVTSVIEFSSASATFTHSNGTINYSQNVSTGGTIDWNSTTFSPTFYNFTMNISGVTCTLFSTTSGRLMTVANNCTVTAGTFKTLYAGQNSVNLTVTGDMTVNGTYVPNTNTTTFDKVGTSTLSGSGTIDFYNLNCSGSTQVNISNDIGINSGGAVTPSTGGSFVPSSGVAITFA